MFPNATNTFFRGRETALLTKHHKEQLIAPLLEPFLGIKVVQLDDYDTDKLGTFTRDVKRTGTQLETARKKARIGMELTGLKLGLANEGSFGVDPYTGFMPWNIEVIVLIDDIHDLEIVGVAQGSTKIVQEKVDNLEKARRLVADFGFPASQVIVRPDDGENPYFVKGVATWDQFEAAFHDCWRLSKQGLVFIESDFRAHANPARQNMIRLAAINLLLKLHSHCPNCHAPGYWVTETKPGLPCEYCGAPTAVFRAQIYRCPKCDFSKEVARSDLQFADQGSCSLCNP